MNDNPGDALPHQRRDEENRRWVGPRQDLDSQYEFGHGSFRGRTKATS